MKKIKKASLLIFKGVSAFCFAYVLALVGQELLSYGLFSFVFLLLSISMAFFYLVKDYKFLRVLMVDVCLIFLAVLLRFYVIMAYGS